MNNLKYSIVICTLILLSCKTEAKREIVESIEEISTPELIIRMGFKTDKEDVFRVSLNNIKVDELQRKNIQIQERIPVTQSFESIEAKFGQGNLSNSIAISLGNKEVKSIDFNAIEFNYGGNSVLITKNNFNKFLKINKYIELDSDSFKITTKRADGRHNPLIVARQRLLNELKKSN